MRYSCPIVREGLDSHGKDGAALAGTRPDWPRLQAILATTRAGSIIFQRSADGGPAAAVGTKDVRSCRHLTQIAANAIEGYARSASQPIAEDHPTPCPSGRWRIQRAVETGLPLTARATFDLTGHALWGKCPPRAGFDHPGQPRAAAAVDEDVDHSDTIGASRSSRSSDTDWRENSCERAARASAASAEAAAEAA